MSQQNFFNQLVKKEIKSNFQIFATPDFLEQNLSANLENVKFFQELINEVAKVKIDYPKNRKLKVSMVVIPRDLYAEISGNPFGQGINAGPNPYDEVFKFAIYIDDISFLQRRDWSRIDILHEISHVVHGAFFRGIGPFGEGFAEALPLYIMDLEKDSPNHIQKICEMKPDDFLSLTQIMKRGMNPESEIKQNLPIALRKSYIVIYLITRGILQRLVLRNGGDKAAALNEFLRKFHDFQPLADEMKLHDELIFKFAGLSESEGWKTLQAEAQSEICEAQRS